MHSVLRAARRDAEFAFTAQEPGGCRAQWLGSPGCLLAIEVLGKSVEREGQVRPEWAQSRAMLRAIWDFAGSWCNERSARALYALRCSIAHEFGLRNDGRPDLTFVFRYEDTGPFLTHAPFAWDGQVRTSWSKRFSTRVNIVALPAFANAMVSNAAELQDRGEVRLAENVTPEEVVRFGMFRVTDNEEDRPVGFEA